MELSEERSSQQFAGSVVVAFLKGAAELELGLALSGSCGACHGEQCVGHLGHGADHDHGSLRQTPLHDGRNAVDGLRVPSEVPPNFITIIGVSSLCPAGARLGEDSSQVSLSL